MNFVTVGMRSSENPDVNTSGTHQEKAKTYSHTVSSQTIIIGPHPPRGYDFL